MLRLSNPACQAFLERVANRMKADGRFSGLLVAGSALAAQMDDFSDLDLVLVCRPEAFDALMKERRAFAWSCGKLLSAFTGEHVGEPALLICLFNDPLLHVDLKFVLPRSLESRVENPLIAWSADGELEALLARSRPQWPNASAEWFEERVWIWIHYSATKLGRGELFEAIDTLALIRQAILGPMICRNQGRDQRGVRRIEQFAPEFASALRGTLCSHERPDVLRALNGAVELYLQLRAAHRPANANEECARAVTSYLASLR